MGSHPALQPCMHVHTAGAFIAGSRQVAGQHHDALSVPAAVLADDAVAAAKALCTLLSCMICKASGSCLLSS